MRPVSVKEILEFTDGRLLRGEENSLVKSISLDSRKTAPGDFFIALRGPKYDGHNFMTDVVSKGAFGIMVEDDKNLPQSLPELVIKVNDTTRALGDIAKIYRQKYHGTVIGVTGSVGKTTTKEFIFGVLSTKKNIHKNEGTLNNHIGVPMTLFELNADFDAAVIEMGMSGLGEIRYLSGMTKPDIGVITHVGPAHLEQLGTVENVFAAKAEMLEMVEKTGIVLLNRDDEFFHRFSSLSKNRIISVGRHHESDFQALDIEINSEGLVNFKIAAKIFNAVLKIKLTVIGLHNIYPSLFAAAAGYCMGLTPDAIIAGLNNIKLPKMRLEVKEVAGMRVIDDCYNANPLSMRSALETLSMIKGTGKKIFVCGDMLELGKESEKYHAELGGEIVKSKIDRLIAVGNLSHFAAVSAVEKGMNPEFVRKCKNNLQAVSILGEWLEPGDTVLVKGSRANHMEEITRGMEEYYNSLEKLIV